MNKILILVISVFTLVSFAQCPPGDPNCVMKDGGAGTNVIGIDCPGCRVLEKSKVRLGGTSTNYRPGSSDTDSPEDVGIGN